jgi:hypothetical protein
MGFKISTSALHSGVLPGLGHHVLLNWSWQSLLTVILFVVYTVYCGGWLKKIVWTDGKPVRLAHHNWCTGLGTSIRVNGRATPHESCEIGLGACARHGCLLLAHWSSLAPHFRVHHPNCRGWHLFNFLLILAVSVPLNIVGERVLLRLQLLNVLVLLDVHTFW